MPLIHVRLIEGTYDRGEKSGPLANMAKLRAADASFRACDRALQTFGGFGYATEYNVERYWRDGNELRATITVEDPMFLRKPASYTTRWAPAPKGTKLSAFDCDPESARAMVKFLVPRYK